MEMGVKKRRKENYLVLLNFAIAGDIILSK
jgi:hypothetical protein